MIEQRFLDREEKRKIKKVMAIVVHWDGGGVKTIDGLWNWMNDTDHSYHYFVSKDRIIQTRSKDLRAIHCGHPTYTKKAGDFFGGNICSSKNSPNNYTIGVCILHDKKNGSYTPDTIETALELISGLCTEYELSPLSQILRHSDITDEKEIPCPRAFFTENGGEELWTQFKEWIDEDMKDNVFSKEHRRHGL